MPINASREQRRKLELENAKWPTVLQIVPEYLWPSRPSGLMVVWRSRDFAVQAYMVLEECANLVMARLSVNRTSITGDRWTDNITWDDLQRLKGEAGFADHDAVEIYPNSKDQVNDANMRHLWIMREPIPFAWRNR